MKALPYIDAWAMKAHRTVPYEPMAVTAVPLIAPEDGDSTIQLDKSLVSVSMGIKAAPDVSNATSSIAKQVRNALPFFGIMW